MTRSIPGYTYDDPALAPSPVAPHQLDELLASVLWSDDDRAALRRAGAVLGPQTEAILDVWYGFVGSTPHLVATFSGADGQPDPAYLDSVRARFGRWITDLCERDFDATWLAYQHEIARRHAPEGKNRTDGHDSTSSHVPLAHLIALIVPITITIRDFLAADDASPAEVEARYQAWFKAVTVSVALWSRAYRPDLW
ncbi:MAG: protogloblin ApPgb [Actinobacteria bacterium]|nr:protogloblin ApPgb [Actinomycetota bacterium]